MDGNMLAAIFCSAFLIFSALMALYCTPIKLRYRSRGSARPVYLYTRVPRHRAAAAAHRPAVPPPSAAEIEAAVPSSVVVDNYFSASDHSEKPNPYPKECAICLHFLEDKQRVRRLPACAHIFHADCIDRWFARVCSCPFCRTAVSIPKLAHVQFVVQELARISMPAAQGFVSSEAASYSTNGASLPVNNDDWTSSELEDSSNSLKLEIYGVVNQEDIIDGTACFMAKYVSSLSQLKDLSPKR
ncbi:hypothetical protein L7F22_024645 [Adiantum nelumboides]|nr:hypothetical protein [Adiantum nelumboides]